MKEIQTTMQSLTDLHKAFNKKNYQLSDLDKHSLKNTIEQLHTKLLAHTSNNITNSSSEHVPHSSDAIQTMNQASPPVTGNDEAKQNVESMNKELDELFSSPAQHASSSEGEREENSRLKLGINEQIMFARELFGNDTAKLQESIRKFQSFNTKQEAIRYYKKDFVPAMKEKGKDTEVVNEFEQLIHRIY